jgi:catechol 2,3-dioxygenase-like lactoylglutathione lyase family enzyme
MLTRRRAMRNAWLATTDNDDHSEYAVVLCSQDRQSAPTHELIMEVSMTVKRIVTNVAAKNVQDARAFYADLLDLRVVMDHGWIMTFAADGQAAPQISIASEGGSGTPVPDVSIEVDDLDAVYRRIVARGLAIEYGPVTEPWGVRRFYVRDPFGRLVNVLAHV